MNQKLESTLLWIVIIVFLIGFIYLMISGKGFE